MKHPAIVTQFPISAAYVNRTPLATQKLFKVGEQVLHWQYRITFSNRKPTLCYWDKQIFDPLYCFRSVFRTERVEKVEERSGGGQWIDSALLPTSKEEADALESDSSPS
jgi:hypothetical protein